MSLTMHKSLEEMGEAKLTPAMMRALAWFGAQGKPVALFDGTAPSKTMRDRLLSRGLIEIAGTMREPGQRFGFTAYRITDVGRALLPAPPLHKTEKG